MPVFRFLIILLTFILINVYLFMRGWQAIPSRYGLHLAYSLVYVVTFSSIFFAIFLGNRLPIWLGHAFEIIGGYWMILFVYIVFAAIIGDLLRLANNWFGIFPQAITANYQAAKFGYLISVLVILFLISIIGYIRFNNPTITRLNVPFENPHRDKTEIHAVVISDTHLGNLIRKERLSNWVELINEQKPDIILIAGDLIDHSLKTVELQKMEEELLQLKATYGVYAIPGNHDYYAGIEGTLKFMKRSGITVLRDSVVIIDNKIALIGRDDITNRNRRQLGSLVEGLNSGMPRIVLDHQPHSMGESLDNQIDLHISGHTHNGQIFPLNLIVAKIYELGYGYKKTGNTHYFVSSGLGLWGAPLRFGTRSEIVSIMLKVN